ncbi:hypothetical protein M8J77_017523 [Diaphorina citri]|nr:hypothetical protein M8J77_017523 [Diaphorina citri]
MALKKCDPIDPDKYGRNSHLGGIYCDHNVPVHMINRLLEEDLQRRHKVLKCCSTEPDVTYKDEIFLPGVDILHREVAFGKWAIPKLKKELWSPDLQLVSKALCSLIDLSFNPERSVEILCHNIISRLGRSVTSSSPFIRQHVAILLRCIANAPYGCNHIVGNKYLLDQILLGLDDPMEQVRYEYLRTVYVLVSSSLVLQELSDASYIEVLISKLSSEQSEFCLLLIIHCLEHLAHTSSHQQEYQIQANVIESVHDRLKGKFSDRTKIGLLGILAQLMKHPDGKGHLTPELFHLMLGFILNEKEVSPDLQVNSMRILTFAAITTENKLLLVQFERIAQLIEKLIDLVRYHDKNMQLSSIQLLTVISETKYGREFMMSRLEFLQEMIELNGDRDDVVRALEILLRVIQWTP